MLVVGIRPEPDFRLVDIFRRLPVRFHRGFGILAHVEHPQLALGGLPYCEVQFHRD
jgi:hypothetical protein